MTFEDVVEFFGGIPAMAKKLGIERQAIYQWHGVIPKARAFQIQALTDGALKAVDLPTTEAA